MRSLDRARLLLGLAALLWLYGGIASAQDKLVDPLRRVLLLHSFGPHFAPWNAIASRLREELIKQSPNPIDLYETALEGDRFGPSPDQAVFVDHLRALFAQRRLDLVIALGAPAVRFVQQNRPRLFESTPLLISSADERTIAQTGLSDNDAAIAVTIDQATHIAHILQVLPKTTTIAVVIGDSPLERFWVKELRQAYQQFADRVTFNWLNELSADDMLEQVRRLPPDSAIYYATVRVDARGVPQEEDRVLSRLHAVANAPVFTYIDSSFGSGIVGGSMLSTSEVAQKTIAAALRILGGEPPANVRTPTIRAGAPIYDARELQRWGIAENSLPPGSRVMFREPSPWRRYRWQLLSVIGIVLLQATLIAALLHQRSRRRLAEIQSQQRLVELAHVNRHSTANELSASIAHEINQPLGAILSNSEAAQLLLDAQSPDLDELREIIADIHRDDQRAADVIRRLRSLVSKKPFELRTIDFNETMGEVIELVSVTARQRGVNLIGSFATTSLPVHGDGVQLQQVAINLIINAMDAMLQVKGNAPEIVVRTVRGGDHVELIISDNGPGIPPDIILEIFNPFFTTKTEGMGMGLSIARTIVEAHGGSIWAENRLRGGAKFHIVLPLVDAVRPVEALSRAA
jgi:signal transduction histidine kinase